ncbi:MAG: GlsB/YeaQ/YmgE family stress response membrane protein [Chloroflexi bacterium]|nr:GlsB/YeaQ/YmgE family stress response membrane protein [Chloroflexota bacterium]
MGILAWIVVGLISGWLASRVMKGRGSGLVGDLVLGVVGALLGGFLASTLLKMPDAVNGINVTSILVAFVGAVILIALLRAVSGRRRLL